VVQSDPNREWAYERIVFRYVYGVGVDCDLAAAVEWYCRGVLAGADGTFFKNGLDIDPNRNLPIATYGGGAERPLINFVLPDRGQLNGRFVAVLTLYLKAARTNDPKALMQIGEMYLAGRGAPVSAAKAWPWLTLAAQRGDATAGAKLANIESKMTKDELNDARQTLPALAQRLKAVASAAGHLKIESKNLGPTAM
jgi:TPR repeat protein